MLDCVPLSETEVHVWYCLTDDPPWSRVYGRYLALLSPDERARHDRFVFDENRRQFLLARTLVRSLLSCYAAAAPDEWEFEYTAYGKPYIAPRFALPHVRFNYSHSDHVVACVIARDDEVGIDVEAADRDVNERIASHCLSPAELVEFERADPRARRRILMRHWTLKEAYAKAKGLGLSLPFTRVTCAFTTPERPTLIEDSGGEDIGQGWQFRQWVVEERYLLGLAVARPATVPCRCVVRRTLPPLDAPPSAAVPVWDDATGR